MMGLGLSYLAIAIGCCVIVYLPLRRKP